MNKAFLIIFLFSFLISSCVKDKPNPVTKLLPGATSRDIIITNEGSYGNNNGDISLLQTEQGAIYNNLFYSANQTRLGDVLQSISLINGYYYAVLNNSGKIVVIDTATYKPFKVINGLHSPRYITQVGPGKAYVSNLYSKAVDILDLNSNTLTGQIMLDYPNSEAMLVSNQSCFISNWNVASSLIYMVDTNTDTISMRIDLGNFASHDLVKDKAGKLWVLSGNKYKSVTSALSQIDPVDGTLLKQYIFQAEEDPMRLGINSTGDTLYYINVSYTNSQHNGLYRFPTNAAVLPANPFIKPSVNTYFWGWGLDSVTQHFFISDPKGFTQQSTIYEYDRQGGLIRQYAAGVGASQFLFK